MLGRPVGKACQTQQVTNVRVIQQQCTFRQAHHVLEHDAETEHIVVSQNWGGVF